MYTADQLLARFIQMRSGDAHNGKAGRPPSNWITGGPVLRGSISYPVKPAAGWYIETAKCSLPTRHTVKMNGGPFPGPRILALRSLKEK
jgi:hypothetical protein